MESHPLTNFVVGAVGLSILSFAIWFGCTDGNTSAEDSETPSPNKMPAEVAALDENTRPPISPEGPYPEVKLDEDEYDFSVMAVGGDGSHSFVVHNVGKAPLILKKGPTTCKCTISELEAGEIPPGESAIIDLTWKIRSLTPRFEQHAIIWTNDPNQEEFELVIGGNVTETFMVRPAGTWALDDITLNANASVTGVIYSPLLDSFEIDETQLSSGLLIVEVKPLSTEELKELGAKSGYEVKVSASPDVPVGTFREKLTFNLMKQEFDPVEVYVKGRRTGPITFLSARQTHWNLNNMSINLGQFDAKQGASGAIFLFVRGLEDEEFKFTSVESDPDDLQIELKPDHNFRARGRKKYELHFRVPPGRRPETRSSGHPAVVEIKTNHPEARTLKFQLKYISR